MTDLYDALENCLHEIEGGAEIESVLLRYPDLADELRPILHASLEAKSIVASEPTPEVVRRNRAKILQHAAELREAGSAPRSRFTFLVPLRRFASTLAVLFLAIASGTSLVGAASTSLPGDNFYPFKRSWEKLQLALTFDAGMRSSLEVDQENERIEELQELFAGKRTAEVSFNGIISRQAGAEWWVAGIRVVIAPDTDLPVELVPLNAAVRVQGWTQADGSVISTSLELLSPEETLPDVKGESQDDLNQQEEGESESGNDAPIIPAANTLEPDGIRFDGILNVTSGDFWTINGVPSDVSNAEIEGTPAVGAAVTVEGYFNPDGMFIITKIKFEEDNSGSGGEGDSNSNSNSNDDDSSNNNSNDNSNDDDNSGSGGGDD
jgi:hypothetical protein